ncbi:MAG: alpha/beta hydrolase [Acidobacteria bacterium]|nr:MAG: alpha/beta hydrolase [Acidobacteriota bacterium]
MLIPCRHLTLLSILIIFSSCSAANEAERATAQKTLENGSFIAELSDGKIHYEVHGAGPVLMVLPNSWGINIAPLRAFYRPLESKLTVVYYDPRGMGTSQPVRVDADMSTAAVRRDFDALRQHLGLARVNAIGWSNGAMNLILLASEKPETLEKAVFLHGTASFSDDENKALAQEHPELMKAFLALNQDLKQSSLTDEQKNARLRELWLGEYLSILAANPEAARPKVAEVFKDCPFSWRHLLHSQQEWPTFDARDRLSRISAPSLVLAGAKDSIPVVKAEEMQRGIRNSKVVVFPNSGHFAPIEEPAAFQKEVLSWLESDQSPTSE